MRTWLNNMWEYVRTSLWFVPLTFILFSVGLGLMATLVDEWYGDSELFEQMTFLYRSGAENSLAILATIAGSAMTVASVSFSITIVALTLASSQFGPRLLRNFMRSFTSQAIIGSFTGTFVYCLFVMRSVDPAWEEGSPHLSITIAVGLALLCVCLLIYFVHHVASSIQADNLVAQVHEELESAIRRLPELKDGESGASLGSSRQPAANARAVLSRRSGYVLAIDSERLSSCADEGRYVVIFAHRPGGFVIKGSPIAWLEGAVSEEDQKKAKDELLECVYLGRARSPEQDLEYTVSQLVEIAVRALSPGINDPKTAETCIDYLVASLCQLSDREVQRLTRRYGRERPCVFVPDTDFAGIVNESFNRIRQCFESQPSVIIRMIEGLSRLAARLERRPERLEAVTVQVRQIEQALPQLKVSDKDRTDLESRLKAFYRRDDGPTNTN